MWIALYIIVVIAAFVLGLLVGFIDGSRPDVACNNGPIQPTEPWPHPSIPPCTCSVCEHQKRIRDLDSIDDD